MARVVGNTGAMDSPAIKTSTAAAPGLLVRSMRNVVIAIAIDAASVTVTAGTWMRMGETATRPMSRPSAKPSERILSAFDSGIPWAIRWRGSQFHTPTSQEM